MNVKMKNILHVITSLNIGGTEKFLLNSLRYLKTDYNFVVCYLKERGPIADEIEKLAIPVFQVNGLRDLISFIRRHPMDIVHTHLYRANIIGRLAAHIAGVPVIISSQRSIDGWKNFYHVWLDRWTARYADVIIANSQAARDVLILREKIPASKIKIIYNGVEFVQDSFVQESAALKEKLNLAPGVTVIGSVLRFHREKGARLLPEIISKVVDKNPLVKFILLGDGPEKGELENLIRKQQLDSWVIFTGFQSQVRNFLAIMDIFFLPSKEESFPQVLLDALGAGLPSVSTDVGGVREIISPGETGLLAKSGDTKQLSEAIIWLLVHEVEAQKLGEKGKKLVAQNFILKEKMEQIKRIYCEIT